MQREAGLAQSRHAEAQAQVGQPRDLGFAPDRGGNTDAFQANVDKSQNLSRQIINPGLIAQDTMGLFNMLASSPAFRMQLQQAQGLGNQVQSSFGSRLGRLGLQGSGVAQLQGALGAGAGGAATLGAQGNLFGQAQGLALQGLLAQMGIFGNIFGGKQQADSEQNARKLGPRDALAAGGAGAQTAASAFPRGG